MGLLEAYLYHKEKAEELKDSLVGKEVNYKGYHAVINDIFFNGTAELLLEDEDQGEVEVSLEELKEWVK